MFSRCACTFTGVLCKYVHTYICISCWLVFACCVAMLCILCRYVMYIMRVVYIMYFVNVIYVVGIDAHIFIYICLV
jgi:hypothetical protein